MSVEPQSIELEIEVAGRPEAVWQSIATGPGISSWYVPHTVEERAGGAASASFGPAPEMQVAGRVAVWDPPTRIVFDGGEEDEGLTFEWTVEPRGDDTCVVRLVNSGFEATDDGDAHRQAMAQGWLLFLENLRMHREHFPDETATAVLPMAMWAGPRERTWATLTDALGLPEKPESGERIEVTAAEAPPLAGEVTDVAPWRVAVLLDEPARGTAFLATEGDGEQVGVSIWSYLYGVDGAAAAERDEPRWREWLEARGLPDG